MKEYCKKHLINIRGKRVKKPFLVIESDDWGAIRIPNPAVQKNLLHQQLIKEEDPFSQFDCLESAGDLQALYDVLGQFKDHRNNSPVLTANMVISNPDFEAIRKANFQSYFWEPFNHTYERYYPGQNTESKLFEGIKWGYLQPQFHAMEHLNVAEWMNKLRAGDEAFHRAFTQSCYAIDDPNKSNNRTNLMATYDYNGQLELTALKERIQEGLALFQSTFSFKSCSTVAPCYVWNEEIESIWQEQDIKVIQGSKFQQYKDPNTGLLKRKWRYSTQRNPAGQIYFVRNVLFEPALNQNINWVEKALESIAIAFFWGKPAIIGSHRINYVGGLSEKNRSNSLSQLEALLTAVVKKWPDVNFISSAELSNTFYA